MSIRGSESARSKRGALLLVAASIALAGAAVPFASTPSAAAVGSGPVTVKLLSQTESVHYGDSATFVVDVTGAPDDAVVRLNVLNDLTPRSSKGDALSLVRRALAGDLPRGRVGYLPFTPLSTLVDLAPGRQLDVHVIDAQASAAADVFFPEAGIYPIQIMVLDATHTTTLGQAVTFLRLDDGIEPAPLSAAVLLPIEGATAHLADGSVSPATADLDRLSAAADVLAALPTQPITVAPRPELLEAAATTNPSLINRFTAALDDRPVITRSYVQLDLAAALNAGLQDDVARQLAKGEQALRAVAPRAQPDRRTWLADRPLDENALGALRRLGVQQLVVDDKALVGVVSQAEALHRLSVPTSEVGLPLDAMVIDHDLNDFVFSHATVSGDPAQDLAFDIQIQALAFDARQSGAGRPGLLLVPPDGPGTTMSQELAQVFRRLETIPGVEFTTVDDLFRVTSTARDSSGQLDTVRLATTGIGDLSGYAGKLEATRLAIRNYGSMLGELDRAALADIGSTVSFAAAADLSQSGAQAFVDRVTNAVSPLRTAVHVLDQGTITLAGRTGQIPLDVRNDDARALTVKLYVLSNKLSVASSGQDITLPPKSTTHILLPVTVRTPAWKFSASIELRTPEGAEAVGTATTLDLRSIGLSGLGVVASVSLGLVLASWWLHHVRLSRRRRRIESHPSANQGSDEQRTNLTV